MADAIIGRTYEGKINGERFIGVGIEKDEYTGSETVLYKSIKNGKVYEYGLQAFKKCHIKMIEE